MKGYFRKRGSKWSFSIDIGRNPETGKRKQKTVSGFKTKKEAEKVCAELIAQIENGSYVNASSDTFGPFILNYMETVAKQETRPSTYYSQLSVVKNHLVPELGRVKLKDLSPIHLQKFYNMKLKEGLSNNYVRKMHGVINKALNTALKWGMISKNPGSLVKPPRANKRDIHVWSMEQANHFLEFMKGKRNYIVFVLAIYTGMRRGEILALRWQDCNLDEGKLSVRQTLYGTGIDQLQFRETKTKAARRVISLPPFVVNCLKKHKTEQNEQKLRLGNAYKSLDLVVATPLGTPVEPNTMNDYFQKQTKHAGLPVIRFHDLRHTHATILLRMGENPKLVSERLGHASVTITLDTYSHVLPDMQKDLAANLEIAMRNSRKTLPSNTLVD
ncbi:site-specific integrase [Aneurinibacillus aneurinilyticus]|uniref:Site-specific integrase n=1 Tax=Aneurinibacillus aneurinilyticus TaxID=1391 RepID=A0A848CSS1_ANEAE|nr:site-specific integrase [Aneurinibacillus aneurinilyticus]NME98843.1 site-specific integrase [Aneurinibacillus aneurinilyticus]